MSTISLNDLKDIRNICKNGDLLITYYRDCDMTRGTIRRMLKYIDNSVSGNYNWIKVNISDCQESCIRQGICPPCTIWYKDNMKKHIFLGHREYTDIIDSLHAFNSLGF